jgi:hypothetical protein
MYDDNGFPWRTLYLWPVPFVQIGVVIYTWPQLPLFPDLSTDFQWPPGYADALKFNLAVRLSDEFGGFVPPGLPVQAQQAIAKLKSVNMPLYDLRVDPAITTSGRMYYNWLSDSPVGGR